jgi:hypothetical protein
LRCQSEAPRPWFFFLRKRREMRRRRGGQGIRCGGTGTGCVSAHL